MLHNAQLSSQKRINTASANHLKHKTHRKLKMPHVFGLLELFVMNGLYGIPNLPANTEA
ncbi:hypothetical protein HC752_24085 [Vibrio sp. S9_S30]|uniref:hypothetical protein n=1 Tax=Vibrio sp. S9_S30 TaxID=2720226 RepID=UPI001680A238|nr:hypothetical protein [Vibrio sp. S9_S30]MBD1560002.1 hypothetical protein [Vibrio sp. S9_S30]